VFIAEDKQVRPPLDEFPHIFLRRSLSLAYSRHSQSFLADRALPAIERSISEPSYVRLRPIAAIPGAGTAGAREGTVSHASRRPADKLVESR
jgi:hypothetical protein